MTNSTSGLARTRFGPLEVSVSTRGTRTFRLELWHEGLNKHRLVRGSDSDVVKRTAELQATEWERRWADRQSREGERHRREASKALAAERTAEAGRALEALDRTLAHTLSVDDAIDWEKLKDTSAFATPPPVAPPAPTNSPEPSREDDRYRPNLGFLDRLFATRRAAKEARAVAMWQKDRDEWNTRKQQAEEAHRGAVREFEEQHAEWKAEKSRYLEAQRQQNAAVDEQRQRYRDRDPRAIEQYCDMVLSRSEYPDWMPKEFELSYVKETGTLLVAYSLPSIDVMPRLREVAYVQSRNEMRERELTDAQARKLYDAVIYQIVLRTVHEIIEADQVEGVRSVVFNGYVTAVDPATGRTATTCILSLHASREEFVEIDLAHVDPRACFRALKGVGSSKLHSMAAVAPIMDMQRDDGRFVAAREVADGLDDSFNLASMDWEEFEHLTRELFEQEFRASGGEVKVTQASRDGGVDAIAFDPDPIRGGKIVIQAKRYTNTVGVAAVRDLYGTVMNEGANKGILVTTSDYGPDAYGFAKDKPLTLLNGANLLHLLEKHGHRAHIDLSAATD